MGQNDDIEPATATRRVAEAGGLQAGPARGERVRDDHLGAGPDVLLVDPLHRIGLIQVRAGAPGDVIHGHAFGLQLTAHAAVDDHQLTAGEPPGEFLGHAHTRLLSSRVLAGNNTFPGPRARAQGHSLYPALRICSRRMSACPQC